MEMKADTEGHEGTQKDNGERITSRSTGKDKHYHRVFEEGGRWNTDGRGRRVDKVYIRCGSFYARWRDPATRKERFVRSPDGSWRGAVRFLEQAAKHASGRAAFAFSEAVTEKLQPERGGWTIERCLEEYKRIAPAHFASISSGRRKRGGGLVHTLWAARTVFAAAMDKPISEAPRALAAYVADQIAKGKKAETIRGEVTQAKSIFSRWAVFEYEDMGCRVPDLKWRGIPPDEYQYELPPQELRDRTIAAGKEELAKGSEIGVAFLLCFYCAMAAGDACRARFDWMDASGTVHYQRVKTGKDADPRLSPEVAARWRELAKERGGGAVLLPDSTEKERNDFVVREFSKWMKGLGWTMTNKKSHELRKLMCSIWYTTPGIGAEWTQAWSGDSLEVLQKHYARLLPERAPAAPSV